MSEKASNGCPDSTDDENFLWFGVFPMALGGAEIYSDAISSVNKTLDPSRTPAKQPANSSHLSLSAPAPMMRIRRVLSNSISIQVSVPVNRAVNYKKNCNDH